MSGPSSRLRGSWCGALTLLIGCSAVSEFGYSFAAPEADGGGIDASAPDGASDAAPAEGAVADATLADATLSDGATASPDGGQDDAGHVPEQDGGGCTLSEASEQTCEGGRDEDCDGLVDCADSDCRQSAICCPAPSFESGDGACADQRDNDCDGLFDCEDSGCSGAYLCMCGPITAEGWSSSPASCVNNNDDDCDHLIDCEEPGCAPSPGCCTKTAELEVGPSCTDGVNNDCDVEGADCADPDCRMNAMGATERESGALCGNRLDDDCDGVKDCADPDCREALECCVADETPEVSCGDGKNNDCDARGADCLDEDCAASPACCRAEPENSQKACQDGVDNDCDGALDCADSNCRQFERCCEVWLAQNGLKRTETEAGFCLDAFDNDCDGAPNCKDSDCALTRNCGLVFESAPPPPVSVEAR